MKKKLKILAKKVPSKNSTVFIPAASLFPSSADFFQMTDYQQTKYAFFFANGFLGNCF